MTLNNPLLPAAMGSAGRLKFARFSAVVAFSPEVGKWAARSRCFSAIRKGWAGSLATSASLTVVADSGSSLGPIGYYFD